MQKYLLTIPTQWNVGCQKAKINLRRGRDWPTVSLSWTVVFSKQYYTCSRNNNKTHQICINTCYVISCWRFATTCPWQLRPGTSERDNVIWWTSLEKQGRIQKFWSGGANRGAEGTEEGEVWGGSVPLPTWGEAWGGGSSLVRGSAPSPENCEFCISNGDFWCILDAIFYSSHARFTHKSSALDLKSAAKFTNWGVLSSRSTETAKDTRNSLMENMLCLFSTIRCNEICV